jgi:archaellum biogenesis protein FlaJ (TadC family)
MKVIDYEKRAKNSLRVILDEIFPLEDADLENFGILARKIDNPFKRLNYLIEKLKTWY